MKRCCSREFGEFVAPFEIGTADAVDSSRETISACELCDDERR